MKLTELVLPGAIIPELASSDRNGAIRELVQALARCGVIDESASEGVAKTLVQRERTRGTTGFGKGVAAPHAKIAGLKRVSAAVWRSSRGIDFDSLDGQPVFGIVLILSPDELPEEHLRAMDLVFRSLQQERFRKFLRQSNQVEQIVELLQNAYENLLVG